MPYLSVEIVMAVVVTYPPRRPVHPLNGHCAVPTRHNLLRREAMRRLPAFQRRRDHNKVKMDL